MPRPRLNATLFFLLLLAPAAWARQHNAEWRLVRGGNPYSISGMGFVLGTDDEDDGSSSSLDW